MTNRFNPKYALLGIQLESGSLSLNKDLVNTYKRIFEVLCSCSFFFQFKESERG